MTDTGYSMPIIRAHANHWTSGFVPGLQEIAKKLSIAIVSGVSERDGSSIYNSQVLVNAEGNVAAKYRKTHLVCRLLLEKKNIIEPCNTFARFVPSNVR